MQMIGMGKMMQMRWGRTPEPPPPAETRITETSDTRITEDGDTRVTEGV